MGLHLPSEQRTKTARLAQRCSLQAIAIRKHGIDVASRSFASAGLKFVSRSGLFLWTLQRRWRSFFGVSKGGAMGDKKSEVLQGTLDLMVLKTLRSMGPLHGFGIARRIEQLSENVLQLNEGTVYTSLLRLQQQGWIASEWGTSENNRKARFYSITRLGKKQLEVETENWERFAGVVGRVLSQEGQG
jgi:transcriptional regulator